MNEFTENKRQNARQAADAEKCCKICMDLQMDCAFFDCRHMIACMKCSEKLTKCPVCRKDIIEKVKIIIS